MKPTADEESDRVPAIGPDEADDPTDELQIVKPGEAPGQASTTADAKATDADAAAETSGEVTQQVSASAPSAAPDAADAEAGSSATAASGATDGAEAEAESGTTAASGATDGAEAEAESGATAASGSTGGADAESGGATRAEAEPDVASSADTESAAAPDVPLEPGAANEDSEWEGLQPLNPQDLEALDPSVLEEDFDQVDDDGEIIEMAEPEIGPASTRRADDLHAGTVLRGRPRPPEAGWRRLIYEVTGGMVQPRLSRSQQERVEQLRVIRTMVPQPRRITVLSRKGGVGKTTTTLMLGQTLASQRGDRIIAVDGNPDAGSLGYRVGPQRPEASITDLLNELEVVHRYADMRRYTAQTPSGLEVLMSDDDPQISTALGEAEYGAVMSLLDRFYNLILIDTGTGILDSAVQGILDGTDQIVLVVAPSLDAARAASQTLDWLSEHGFVGLVESAVTVINQTRASALVDIARIEEHFWDRCGATVRIPWDRYLEAGAETELADLRPATREAYLQLAAAVARRFEP